MILSTQMKKAFPFLLLLSLLSPTLWADFSNTTLTTHPRFPGTDPFIIELKGTWPSDCHPGEQKAVLESYDGLSAEIGFETVVEHITCNDTETPYRVLFDMSEAIAAGQPLEDKLEITVNFGGAKLEKTIHLTCPEDADCNAMLSNRQLAEPGLYFSAGLAKQGLLVARQNEAMAIYPLVYDANGSNEWLFTGTVMKEDTFFTDLLRFSGGDCFGCEPTDATPKMSEAGKLSVLVDRPGLLQVKFNDGPFTAYESLVYGYRTFQVGSTDKKALVDLSGRWAISENLGELTDFFPGAFDVEYEKPAAAGDRVTSTGQASFLVSTLNGQFLGQLVCKGQTTDDGSDVCQFIDPTDAADPAFLFYVQSPSRVAIEYGRQYDPETEPPSGGAVRID
jgi:hypothetical protein